MKVDLKMAEPDVMALLVQGIFFGASFPELTEEMFRKAMNTYGDWVRTVGYGLKIDKEVKGISLEEVEEAVLQMVAVHTLEYYPELVERLDLGDFLRSR